MLRDLKDPRTWLVAAVAYLMIQHLIGCAHWPMYYYRQTPQGTTVVPAQGHPTPPHYRAQSYSVPRGRPR